MNVLNTKANAILADKNTNLTPEVLLKNIETLGVRGILDPSQQIQMYESIEEFEANASTNSYGIIYSIDYEVPSYHNPYGYSEDDKGKVYDSIKILKNFTLSEVCTATTSNVVGSWSYYNNPGRNPDGGRNTAVQTRFFADHATIAINRMTGPGQTINYTSEDGLHYTTSELDEDLIIEYQYGVFLYDNYYGDNQKCAVMGNTNSFYGIYQMVEAPVTPVKNVLCLPLRNKTKIGLDGKAYCTESIKTEFTYEDLLSWVQTDETFPIKGAVVVILFKSGTDYYMVYDGGAYLNITMDGINIPNKLLDNSYSSSNPSNTKTFEIYKIDPVNQTWEAVNNLQFTKTYSFYSSFMERYYYEYICELPMQMDTIPVTFALHNTTPYPIYWRTRDLGSTTTWIGSEIVPPAGYGGSYDCRVKQTVKTPKALETQFTLAGANELLGGVVALGKNGVVIGDGSVWNKLPTNIKLHNVLQLPVVKAPTESSSTTYYGGKKYVAFGGRTQDSSSYVISSGNLYYFKKDPLSTDIATMDVDTVEFLPAEATYDLGFMSKGSERYLPSDDEHFVLGQGYVQGEQQWEYESRVRYKDMVNDEILFDETGWTICTIMNNKMYLYKNNGSALYEWDPNNSSMTKILDFFSGGGRRSFAEDGNKMFVCQNLTNNNTTNLKIDCVSSVGITNIMNSTISNSNANAQLIFTGDYATNRYLLGIIHTDTTNNNSYLDLYTIDMTTLTVTSCFTNKDVSSIITDLNLISSDQLTGPAERISQSSTTEWNYFRRVCETDWDTGVTTYHFDGYKFDLTGTNLPSSFEVTLDGEESYHSDKNFSFKRIDNTHFYYDNDNGMNVFTTFTPTATGFDVSNYKRYMSLSSQFVYDNKVLSANMNFYNDAATYVFNGLDLVSYTSTQNYWAQETNTNIPYRYTLTNYTTYREGTVNNNDLVLTEGQGTDTLPGEYYYGGNYYLVIADTSTPSVVSN